MPGLTIVTDATTAAGIPRPAYRRAIAAQVGPFGVHTTDGVSVSGEARRHVVCSSLIDDEEGADRLRGRYLYVTSGANAGFQTRIVSTGYEGAVGYLIVARPFPSVLAPGSEFELTAPLPCETYLDVKGLNPIVNEALDRCIVEYRLALVGNGTRSHGLLGEDYIDASDWVDAIYDGGYASAVGPVPSAPLERSRDAARIDASGADMTLVTERSYAPGEPFEARVFRRGSTLILNGGAWGSSTVGLTSDDQAAAVPVSWVTAFGTGKALQAVCDLVRQAPGLSDAERAARLGDLHARIATWARAADSYRRNEFPRPSPRPRAWARPAWPDAWYAAP